MGDGCRFGSLGLDCCADEAGVCKVTHYSSEYDLSGRPTTQTQQNKMKPLKSPVLKVRGLNSGHMKRDIGIVLFLLQPCEENTFKGIIHICTESSAPSNGVKSTAAKRSYIRKPSSAAM